MSALLEKCSSILCHFTVRCKGPTCHFYTAQLPQSHMGEGEESNVEGRLRKFYTSGDIHALKYIHPDFSMERKGFRVDVDDC